MAHEHLPHGETPRADESQQEATTHVAEIRKRDLGCARSGLVRCFGNRAERGYVELNAKEWCDDCTVSWLLEQHVPLIAERDSLQVALTTTEALYQELRSATTAADLDHAAVVLIAQANAQDSEMVETLTGARDEARKERDEAKASWRCFHCDEVFTTPAAARDHFGATECADPGCLVDRVAVEEGGKPERGRGLLMALRKAEDRIAELTRELDSVENDARLWHESEADRVRRIGHVQWWQELDYREGEKLVLNEQVSRLTAQLQEAREQSGVQSKIDGERLEAAESQLTALRGALDGLADRVIRQVAELPDRTSPEDWPEAMLVTSSELVGIITAALSTDSLADQIATAKAEHSAAVDALLEAAALAVSTSNETTSEPQIVTLRCRACQAPVITELDATTGDVRHRYVKSALAVSTLPLTQDDDQAR
jgi:hypothetical protein